MIKAKLQKIADRNGLKTTELLDSISTVKKGLLRERWIYCPCEPDNNKRYCGSKMCLNDVKKDGVCHCGLFRKGEE